MRDLRILIDNKLAMSQYIHAIVNKAQSRASLIFNCFHSKHRATLLKAFVTYVRPLLEYASPVWSPSTVTDNQNRISTTIIYKRLPGLKSLSYSKRLEVLDIDSLEVRRLRCDLIYVHKMLFGLVDLNFNDYFTLKLSSTTPGHDYKVFLNFSRLNVRKHFFSEKIVTVWNNLQCSVIDFSSIKRFKTSLLLCDFAKYVGYVSNCVVCTSGHQ